MLVELVLKIDHHRNLFVSCPQHLLLVLVEGPVAAEPFDQIGQSCEQDLVGAQRRADHAAQMGRALNLVVQYGT
jgi:hypothetical protein